MEKTTVLSQIPGLNVYREAVAPIPRPPGWEDKKLSPAVLGSININVLGLSTYDPAKPESKNTLIEQLDDQLLPLFDQCNQG